MQRDGIERGRAVKEPKQIDKITMYDCPLCNCFASVMIFQLAGKKIV